MSAQKKSKRLPHLATALTAAFLGLSVSALLVAGSLQLYFSIQSQRESVAREQQFIAQDAANTVVSFVQEKFTLLEAVAELSDPRVASLEEQERHLRSLRGLEPAFRHLALLDAQGREVVESSRKAQIASGRLLDQAGAEVLIQVQQGRRYVGPVYVDDATSEPMVILAVPIVDVFGDFQGTLMAEVSLKFIWDLVDQLEVGEGGLTYVVDRYGDLIAFGDVTRVLRGENVSELSEVREFISNSALVDETGANISTGINGTNVVATYVPLGTPDWAVVVEFPVAEAYREVIQSTVVSAGVVVVMATLAGLLGVYMARRMSVPLHTLTETASRVAAGEMELQAAPAGPAEVVDLALAFNSMTAQLRELIGGLEERVAARTLELEQRSTYLEASAKVARAASSILNVEQLLQQVVELVQQRFDLYYVGLFLVSSETDGAWAVLREASGEAAQQMLAQGHRLKVAGESMIGQCIADHRPRIALDAGEEAVRFNNLLLPETHSEMALPLVTREGAIGALSVQSRERGAFGEAEVAVFETLAGQLANAIASARLYDQALQRTLELEARNAELDAFAHTVAHDLKSPMSGLIGLSTMLESCIDEFSSATVDDLLHRITQAGYKITNIIDELLLLSSLRREEVQGEALEMADIVSEAKKRLANLVAERQAEISVSDEWPTVVGYAPWVEEVWVNYISNALKYGGRPEQEVPPCVELGFDAPINAHVRFWVRDNGHGLTPEAQADLFTPFTRLYQVRAEGHGLGLSIVQRIVEKLGGEVGVESEVDQGSVFYFTLPTTA